MPNMSATIRDRSQARGPSVLLATLEWQRHR